MVARTPISDGVTGCTDKTADAQGHLVVSSNIPIGRKRRSAAGNLKVVVVTSTTDAEVSPVALSVEIERPPSRDADVVSIGAGGGSDLHKGIGVWGCDPAGGDYRSGPRNRDTIGVTAIGAD